MKQLKYIQSARVLITLILFLRTGLHEIRAAEQAVSSSDSTTFLVISDLRISAQSGNDSHPDFLNMLSNANPVPAFVVCTGNVTDSGQSEEYNKLKETTSQIEKNGSHLYAVPGSRDIRWCSDGKEPFISQFGKAYQSFDRGGIHFVLLDSTVFLEPWGHFDRMELDWLAKDLKRQKADTPILLFLHHQIGRDNPYTRPVDNEYDFWPVLKGKHIAAIFNSGANADIFSKTNGIPIFSSAGINHGSYYRINYSPLLLTVAKVTKDKPGQGVQLASIALSEKTKPSVLRAGWDDPAIAFLERRRPAATLDPRAILDNPDKEIAEYKIDEGAWKPMTRDARDVWRDVFLTKGLSIGQHIVGVQLTTSNKQLFSDELIFEVERNSNESTRKWAVDLDGPIISSPILDNDNIYAASLDGKLTALDVLKGKKKWAFSAKGSFVGSPILDGSNILAASVDHGLYSVELATGHQRWRFDAGSPLLTTPAILNKKVIVGSEGKIYGIDSDSGKQLWTVPSHSALLNHIVTDGSRIFVANADGSISAVDANDGSILWTKIYAAKTTLNAISVQTAAPAVSNGRIYMCSNDGVLRALNAENGSEIWHTSAPKNADPLGLSSPVLRDDSVYIAGSGEHGDVYAFDRREGNLLWKCTTGQFIAESAAKVSPDGKSLAIMGLRGRVSVVNTSTGKRLWGYELGPGNIFSTPEYDGNVVYTTTMANDVQAINQPKP